MRWIQTPPIVGLHKCRLTSLCCSLLPGRAVRRARGSEKEPPTGPKRLRSVTGLFELSANSSCRTEPKKSVPAHERCSGAAFARMMAAIYQSDEQSAKNKCG